MQISPTKPTYAQFAQFDLMKHARAIDEKLCAGFGGGISCANQYYETLSTFIGLAGEGLHFWDQPYFGGAEMVIALAVQLMLSGILDEDRASLCNR